MNTTVRSIALGAGVALVIIAAAFGWQYFSRGSVERVVEEPYVNEEYRFSFVVPRGFVVWEAENIVVIEDGSGNGVQIVITPLSENISVLTEERIKADITDLVVYQSKPVEIGGHTGLAFKSDNSAFDGASYEIWFVFESQLYQISTYKHLEPLTQTMVSTWEFF